MEVIQTFLNNLKQITEPFAQGVTNVVGRIPNYRMVSLVVIMFFFIVGIFLIMAKGVKDAEERRELRRNRQTQDYVKQKHNRYITDRINLKLFRTLDDMYKYSRIYTKRRRIEVFNNTSWNYFVTTIIASSVSALIVFALVANPMYPILTFIVFFIARYGYLQFLRMHISRQIEEELVLFLNLLSNYSTGNTEIISTFASIAHKFKPDLRDCLLECVAESQGKGGTISALENLGRKIESRKFKEVLKNLEISQRYSGSFHSTAMALRRDALEYVNEKKKLTGIITQNAITLGIIIASVIGTIVMMTGLLEEPLSEMLMSPMGFGCIAIMVGVVIWVLSELMRINKA